MNVCVLFYYIQYTYVEINEPGPKWPKAEAALAQVCRVLFLFSFLSFGFFPCAIARVATFTARRTAHAVPMRRWAHCPATRPHTHTHTRPSIKICFPKMQFIKSKFCYYAIFCFVYHRISFSFLYNNCPWILIKDARNQVMQRNT